MQELLALILENLKHVGMGVVLFIVAYVCNMSFSIFYNVKVLDEDFDWNKIKDSAIKVAAFGIGTTLLCIGITCVPAFANFVGFTIPEEYQEVFQNLAIISVFIISTCKYLVEAYSKFKLILNAKDNQY